VDEQQLLKEWDFARFFQGLNDKSNGKQDLETSTPKASPARSSWQRVSRNLDDGEAAKMIPSATRPKKTPDPPKAHHDSDPRRYLFRRENSDLFPSRPNRHSALILESSPPERGGNSRRGSEIASAIVSGLYPKDAPKRPVPARKNGSGEPLLTDFAYQKNGEGGDWPPVRPRREKTEGDISLSRVRQSIKEEAERLFRRNRAGTSNAVKEGGLGGGQEENRQVSDAFVVDKLLSPFRPVLLTRALTVSTLSYLIMRFKRSKIFIDK